MLWVFFIRTVSSLFFVFIRKIQDIKWRGYYFRHRLPGPVEIHLARVHDDVVRIYGGAQRSQNASLQVRRVFVTLDFTYYTQVCSFKLNIAEVFHFQRDSIQRRLVDLASQRVRQHGPGVLRQVSGLLLMLSLLCPIRQGFLASPAAQQETQSLPTVPRILHSIRVAGHRSDSHLLGRVLRTFRHAYQGGNS